MSSGIDKSPAGETKVQRLFLALWPDDVLRQRIKRNSKSLLRHGGGRPVTLGNIHITLIFLGNVDGQQQSCIEQVANSIQCPTFELKLDKAGHWSRPKVLWLGCEETPEALKQLVADLYRGIRCCGIELDSRPYQAHLTLMRKVIKPPADLTVEPVTWPLDRFVLVKSTTHPEGVKYEVIREWPLIGNQVQQQQI
jgi:2'-5' RNA ligase